MNFSSTFGWWNEEIISVRRREKTFLSLQRTSALHSDTIRGSHRHTQSAARCHTHKDIYTWGHTNIKLTWSLYSCISHSIGLLQSWLFALTLCYSYNQVKEMRAATAAEEEKASWRSFNWQRQNNCCCTQVFNPSADVTKVFFFWGFGLLIALSCLMDGSCLQK